MLVNANLSIFHLHYLCKLKGRYNNGDSIQSTFNSFLQINKQKYPKFYFQKAAQYSQAEARFYFLPLMLLSLGGRVYQKSHSNTQGDVYLTVKIWDVFY